MVSGHKIWTSSAQLADWIYLAVRTDPDAPAPGLSVLVADIDSPGIEVREHRDGGRRDAVRGRSSTGVQVPADQLVGELNGGWRVLMGTLDHERVTSEKVGVVLRVLDDLERRSRGAPRARLELRGCAARPRRRGCSAGARCS